MSTHTLAVPGATLTYDVHGDRTDGVTPLLLFGSPMDASGFGTLASRFTDRVVVTYDPRNTGRSEREDPTAAVPYEQHAQDLHALVEHLGGVVDAFATSGGAVNALLLVASHPDDLRTLVAHEPPLTSLLPDADVTRAVGEDIVATYDARGHGPAMAKFIAMVMHRGPFAPTYLEGPDPDPAVFGLPTQDDGRRDDPLMANLRDPETDPVPDAAAIAAAATRVVIAVGEESGGPEDGELAVRGSYAVAAHLGLEPIVFPGGHQGFLGGEHGQTGRPDEFAARLREVLG